ncbi:MAG: hypothetical protein KDD11_16055 [Acidobacteria bacterium]|nr:hypothetical protein [Acidobacteriota bacterium]
MTNGEALTTDASTFWSLVAQVLDYGVDKADVYRLLAEDVDFGAITKDDFLAKIYRPRDDSMEVERSLAHRLLSSTSLLALASGRGCGKTSLLLKAASILEEVVAERGQAVRIAYVNIRRLYDRHNLFGLSDVDAPIRFQEVMEQTVRDILFPEVGDERRLVAWLLAGGPDESEKFDRLLVSDLRDISVDVLIRAGIGDEENRAERWQKLLAWFRKDTALFAKVRGQLLPKLRVAHSVLASVFLDNSSRVILLYDNIDRLLNNKHRSIFLRVADNQQAALGTLVTICVAIRTENLLGPWQAEPRGTFVDLFLPNAAIYKGLLLPKPSDLFLSEILEARYGLAQGRFLERHPESKFRPPDSAIHKIIVEQFGASSLHDLTNESVRAACRLYLEFMRYLYLLSDNETVDLRGKFGRERDLNHAETLFYMWLRAFGHVADVHMYDLFDVHKMNGGKEDGLPSIHHLLLTAIDNLTRELSSQSFPRSMPSVTKVFERMDLVDFDRASCERALREMMAEDSESVGTVEIYWPNRGEASEGVAFSLEGARVRLTLLGRRLVSEVFSKVGFVWSLAYSALCNEDFGIDEAYFRHSTLERVSVLLRYLGMMSERHFLYLSGVRGKWEGSFGKTWLTTYRGYYGVGGALQIERIYTECAKFFSRPLRSFGLSKLFDEFGSIYQDGLTLLLRGGEPWPLVEPGLLALQGKLDRRLGETAGRRLEGRL